MNGHLKNAKILDIFDGTVKNTILKTNKNVLGNQKEFPAFAKNSFSKTWKLNLKFIIMLSNTCKYALRALIYLGKFSEENSRIGIKKIAEDLSLSSPFLGKILQNLVKQKLLVSTKGPNGGFALGKS